MEKPILFSTEMVAAILDGRKTQTRRVIKPQFNHLWGHGVRNSNRNCYSVNVDIKNNNGTWKWINCPYGKPGDVLWVRETHHIFAHGDPAAPGGIRTHQVVYKANDEDLDVKWRPSIFMPRWASRLTLRVEKVRVEQVQNITNMDAVQEGIDATGIYKLENARAEFAKLWDNINAKRGYSWQSNPWVWVVDFTLLSNKALHTNCYAALD